VLKKITYRDPAAVVAVSRDEPGQPFLDGVLQRKLALADELERHGGDKDLRVTGNVEVRAWRQRRVGLELGDAAARRRSLAIDNRFDEHSRHAQTVNGVGAPLQRRRSGRNAGSRLPWRKLDGQQEAENGNGDALFHINSVLIRISCHFLDDTGKSRQRP
jgi:hypothetical protein